MRLIGARARRRVMRVEQATISPPLCVILSWLHALLTWFAVVAYPNPESGWTKGWAQTMATYEALPGVPVCALGIAVSLCFLVFLLCEYRRTLPEARFRASVRAAYLSAVVLLIGCAMAWDNVFHYLSGF